MASFTDQIAQFNPYIKDFSTEAYVTAGMFKQQKYDQNVQKVNNYVQSLYGFKVARDVDKQYLDSKINSFTEGLNKFLSSADFSNDSIVNQVGGYAGQIANDKNIQNAVSSAAKMQKHLDELAVAKKEGKFYSPANEYALMQDINKFMTGKLEDPYQSEGYIPAVDVNKEIITLWEKKNPNSRLITKPRLDGSTGWVMLTSEGEKGVTHEQIMAELDVFMTPQLRRQLSLDANYKLAGISGEQYVNSVYGDFEKHYQMQIDEMASLMVSASEGDKKLYSEQIALAKDKLVKAKEDKGKWLETAKKNPSAVKDHFYYEEWKKGMTNFLSYKEVTLEDKIYKDYYDVQKNLWDLINPKKGGNTGEDNAPNPVYVERPFPKDQMQTRQLVEMKTDLLQQKEALDSEWNELASKILADSYDASGLSQEAEALRNANRNVYYDKTGKFISEATYNKLPNSQKSQYTKGNFSRNLVQNEGVSTPIYTVRNKSVLEGLRVQLEKEYNQGNPNLPIEVKEFFDKTLLEKKLLDAKAQAISEIDKELDTFKKSHPQYNEYLKNRQNFVVNDNFNNRPISVSGDELERYFASKGTEVRPNLQEVARKAGLPLEKVEYIRRQETWVTAPSDQAIAIQRYIPRKENTFGEIDREINKRSNELTRGIQGLFNTRTRVLEKGKAEDARNITQLVNYISGLNKESSQDKFRGINWTDVQSILSKEDGQTAFVYGQSPDTGEPFVEITHSDVNGGKPIIIPIDKITAKGLNLYEEDPLFVAKQIMTLKKGVTGRTIAEALPIQHGGKHKISYNLERLQSGNYKLKMYTGGVEFVDNQKSYSEAELGLILKSISDATIENYLQNRETNPDVKPFNLGGSMQGLQFMQQGTFPQIPNFPGVPNQ
jgi:hypothetical protein